LKGQLYAMDIQVGYVREGEPEYWRCEPLAVKIDCMMQQHMKQMIYVDSKGQKPLLGDRIKSLQSTTDQDCEDHEIKP
jgi:hypothetical protein